MIPLTSRQKEVALLICQGKTSKDIADRLNKSIKTIRNHRDILYHKLEVSESIGLLHRMLEHGILTIEQFLSFDFPKTNHSEEYKMSFLKTK